MERKLTAKDRQELVKRHRKERDGRVRDRIKAVLAYDAGYSYAEIAKLLLLDDETIRRHIEDYRAKEKLRPESGGSVSNLSQEEMAELKAHLREVTYRYTKDIRAYVKTSFGKVYSISGMTKWLHGNGFRYKKHHGVPAKADRVQQKAFLEAYGKLKEKAGTREPIYFGDSVHPAHRTRLSYGWIPRGERKTVPTTGKQRHLNFIGGICLQGHRVVYKQTDKVNETSIQHFLHHLRGKHSGGEKIHLIWDNAGYHKSGEVRACAQALNVELHYLPPYSPNLNPIERLWKILHEQVTDNRYYEHFADFTEAVLHFFRHVRKQKRLLRSRITENFQILHSPLLAS